jgi:zinc transporter ZupT
MESLEVKGIPKYGSTEHVGDTMTHIKNPVVVTTIGMVIHCIADGLALGTSVYSKPISLNHF